MGLGSLGRRWVVTNHWLGILAGRFWTLFRRYGWFKGVWSVGGWLCMIVGHFGLSVSGLGGSRGPGALVGYYA